MKYIIVKDQQDKEHGIVFPEALVHRTIARVHQASDLRVVSAGFCGMKDGMISVWGESETLRMKSRPQDAAILQSSFEGFTYRSPFKFAMVHCSSCGKGFGPGDHGFSHCENHKGLPVVED